MDFKTIISEYGITDRNGIIHVGANIGEEIPLYKDLEFQRILLFEPIKESYDKIPNDSGVYKVNLAVGETTKTIDFYVSEYTKPNGELIFGESSSALRPKEHLNFYTGVKFTSNRKVNMTSLDEWFLQTNTGLRPTDFSCLVLDTQGYEGWVLQGAKNLLKTVKVIYTEVSTSELYENNTSLGYLDHTLKNKGFVRKQYWLDTHGSGEAIYISQDII